MAMTQISLILIITVLISQMAERDCKHAHSYDLAIHRYDHQSLFTNVLVKYIGRLFCPLRPFGLHYRNHQGERKEFYNSSFSCSKEIFLLEVEISLISQGRFNRVYLLERIFIWWAAHWGSHILLHIRDP